SLLRYDSNPGWKSANAEDLHGYYARLCRLTSSTREIREDRHEQGNHRKTIRCCTSERYTDLRAVLRGRCGIQSCQFSSGLWTKRYRSIRCTYHADVRTRVARSEEHLASRKRFRLRIGRGVSPKRWEGCESAVPGCHSYRERPGEIASRVYRRHTGVHVAQKERWNRNE